MSSQLSYSRCRKSGSFVSSTRLIGTWSQWLCTSEGKITSYFQGGSYSSGDARGEAKWTSDIVHPNWNKFRNGTLYRRGVFVRNPADLGGDFSSCYGVDHREILCKRTYRYFDPVQRILHEYKGGWIPRNWPTNEFSQKDLTGVGVSGKFSGSYGDGSALGPRAWNQYKPKLSMADLGIFAGESREIPRMLKTTAEGFGDLFRQTYGNLTSPCMGKKVANHWLNHQFGWVPFANDISKFINLAVDGRAALQRTIDHNGHWLKRKGPIGFSDSDIVETLVATATDGKYIYPPNPEPLVFNMQLNGQSASTSKIYLCKSTRSWFSGAFRYWIPSFAEPDKALNTMQNYLRLYGARVSPLLVWNLTPWSWLIDWYTNVGDNISNFQSISQDNMAAAYAYVMQEKLCEYLNRTTLHLKVGPVSPEWRRGAITKTRRHASPYGFTTDFSNFSSYQWSILTALGFSRFST